MLAHGRLGGVAGWAATSRLDCLGVSSSFLPSSTRCALACEVPERPGMAALFRRQAGTGGMGPYPLAWMDQDGRSGEAVGKPGTV